MTLSIEDRIAALTPEKRALLNQRLQQHLQQAVAPNEIRPRDRSQPAVLSFSQQRLWFLQQFEPSSNAYNEASALKLMGELNVLALEHSLNEILQRHEVLRSVIVLHEGEPVQVATSVTFSLPVIDLTPVAATQREANLQQRMLDFRQRPFDLAHDIPVRYVLYRLNETTHVLLSVHHHVASDGWSSGVFRRELSALYNAFVAGQASPLPALPIQYADFAAWQRQTLQGEKLAMHLQYWQTQLAGMPETLNLPLDFARPAQQNTPSADKHFVLSATLLAGLKNLARQSDTTLFMTLLTTFQVLLMRYANQTDIAVGSPIANRQRTEVEGLIGIFINTLVMRNDLSGNPTFREALARVRQTAINAYEHQDLPFEKLVEALNPVRSLNHNPLFQVMLSYQNTPQINVDDLHLAGLQTQRLKFESSTAKFDLSLFMNESMGQVQARLEYDTALFRLSSIDQLAQHFVALLEAVVADPDCPIAQLPMLSATERQQLLQNWHQTAALDTAEQSLPQLFEAQAARTPNAVAVAWREGGETLTLTYGVLNERANQLAHYLRWAGVQPDALVGVSISRSGHLLLALLGILKAGAAYVPVDVALPRERVAFQLADTQMQWIITQTALQAQLPPSAAQVLCIDADWSAISANAIHNPSPSHTAPNLAYVIYTSGSTGQPKGVQIEHRALAHFLQASNRELGLTAADTLLAVTTLTFDIAGLELFLPLTLGARVFIADEATTHDAEQLRAMLETLRPSVMQATPATWQMLLVVGWQAPPKMKMLVGGEALSSQLANTLARNRNPVWNLYGPTETTIWVSSQLIGTAAQAPAEVIADDADFFAHKAIVPIGRPFAGTQMYILDAYLQPVPVGVTGDLYIGGAQVARGYLNRPELTRERFLPHPFGDGRLYKTGDLARYLPNGSIEFLGRSDFQVKIRGFRIELGEIEAAMLQHPAVMQCVALAKEEAFGDKQLVAYVVLKPSQVVTPGALRQMLQQILPAYMVPAVIVILEALPTTPHGKVDHKALAARPVWREASARSLTALTPRQAQMMEIWRDLLQLNQIDIHDNFFDLGGHSLLAVRLLAQIETQFHVRLALQQFIINPSIAQLVAQLEIAMGVEPDRHTSDHLTLTPDTIDQANLFADPEFSHLYHQIGQPKTEQKIMTPHFGFAHFMQRLPIFIGSCVSLILRYLAGQPWLQRLYLGWLAKQPWAEQSYVPGLLKTVTQFQNIINTDVTVAEMMQNIVHSTMLESCGLGRYLDKQKVSAAPFKPPKALLWAELEGLEYLEQAKARGKGVIIVTSHISLIYLSLLASHIQFSVGGLGARIRTLASDIEETTKVLYARQFELATQTLKAGGTIRIGADGWEGFGDVYETAFHNRWRPFHTSFAELALMTGASVLLVQAEICQGYPNKVRLLPVERQDNSSMTHEQLIAHLMDQYVANLAKMWRTIPWGVPWGDMEMQVKILPPITNVTKDELTDSFNRMVSQLNHPADFMDAAQGAVKPVTNFTLAREIFKAFPASKQLGQWDHPRYLAWLNEPGDSIPTAMETSHLPLISNLARYIYQQRPDLHGAFPDPLGKQRVVFALWFITHVDKEYKIPDAFVAPVRESLIKWGMQPSAEGDQHPAKLNLVMHIWRERADLQQAFPNFAAGTQPSDVMPFMLWFYRCVPAEYGLSSDFLLKLTLPFVTWANETDTQMPPLTRFAAGLWQSRADLKQAFPQPNGEHLANYVQCLHTQIDIALTPFQVVTLPSAHEGVSGDARPQIH